MMKVFNLSCELEHAFEGWFASGEEFDRQSVDGLVECPVCGSREVHKLPSAPRLNISGAQEPSRAVKEPVAMPNEAAMRAVRERWRFRPGPPRFYQVAIRFELKRDRL